MVEKLSDNIENDATKMIQRFDTLSHHARVSNQSGCFKVRPVRWNGGITTAFAYIIQPLLSRSAG